MQPPAAPLDRKARAPSVSLTSGAFAFAATPTKVKKPARPIGAFSPFGSVATSEGSAGSSASSRPDAPRILPRVNNEDSAIKKEPLTRDSTPLRAVSEASTLSLPPPRQLQMQSPSQSLAMPTPSRLLEIKKEDITPRKTPKKLSALSSFSISPFVAQPKGYVKDDEAAANGRKRRLGDIEYAIPAIPDRTPTRVVEGRTVGLGAVNDAVRLETIDMDELDAKRGKEEVEKEVGIGVSPRKGKVKWNGRGDPPLSMRLASLTSTESASLTLFYTSLYHTLNPSHRTPAKRSRGPSEIADADPVPKPVSALAHIRTAPIRLVLTRPAGGRTHYAHLWRASVLRWPKMHPSTSPGHTTGQDIEDAADPTEVIVNLAIHGSSTRTTGIDPRVVEERWRREGPQRDDTTEGHMDESRELVSTWEVGVWSEWSMMDMPKPSKEHGGDVSHEKVLFANRYLVAEGKLRE